MTKPYEIIMRAYLWDLRDLKRAPKCPYCLGEVALGVYIEDITDVHCVCRACNLRGPKARGPAARERPGMREAKLAAAARWNQYIERIYHLAHGVIPAPMKRQEE